MLPHVGKPCTPLSVSSGHASHVHLSWPKAVAARVTKLTPCSMLPGVSQSVIDHYKSMNASSTTLEVMSDFFRRKSQNQHSTNNRVCPVDSNSGNLWIKIGAHPLLCSILPKCLGSLPTPVGMGRRPRICWQNVLPSVSNRVTFHNNGKLQFANLSNLEGW